MAYNSPPNFSSSLPFRYTQAHIIGFVNLATFVSEQSIATY